MHFSQNWAVTQKQLVAERKRTTIWALGHMEYFHLEQVRVILGSVAALSQNWAVTQKQLVAERKRITIWALGHMEYFYLEQVRVILGSVSALFSKLGHSSRTSHHREKQENSGLWV